MTFRAIGVRPEQYTLLDSLRLTDEPFAELIDRLLLANGVHVDRILEQAAERVVIWRIWRQEYKRKFGRLPTSYSQSDEGAIATMSQVYSPTEFRYFARFFLSLPRRGWAFTPFHMDAHLPTIVVPWRPV